MITLPNDTVVELTVLLADEDGEDDDPSVGIH